MKSEIEVVEDPERIKIAVEKNRREILELLSDERLTIKEISEEMEKSPSTIYRHINKLEKNGFVNGAGECHDHHIPKRRYEKSAEFFIMCPCALSSLDLKKGPIPPLTDWKDESKIASTFETMAKLGFDKIDDGDEMTDINDKVIKMRKKINERIDAHGEEIGEISYDTFMRIKTYLLMYLFVKDEEVNKDIIEIVDKLTTS